MNRTVKRLLTFVLAFVLIASISIPAFAATKPSATCNYSTNQYVKRNYTYTMKFYLRSGSYTKLRGYYRARFDTDMFRKSNNRLVDWTNYLYFSGNGYNTINWRSGSSTYLRYTWYKLRYRTQYRTSIYSSYWYTSTARYLYFYVY